MLLDEVKAYIRVTWKEDDYLINNLIEEGKAELNELFGVDVDYENNLSEKGLLKDYVRYAYNGQAEWFPINFRKKILRLQLKYGMKSKRG
ncbi:MAG: phage head-tail connector protein [Streptococcus agalactiae]|nr:phage head-tail connector protein [Streptococcus agalactiae]